MEQHHPFRNGLRRRELFYPPTVTQDESNFGRVAVLVGVAVDCVAVDADAAFPMIEADDTVFYAHDGGIEQALEVSIIVFATIFQGYV